MKKMSASALVRNLVVTAMLGAVGAVLMLLNFPVPLMPAFIKMDLSELPALIASFALGPLWGAAVCLVKNLINLLSTTTGGVGELSNFILGCLLVIPAGLYYQHHKTRIGALIGSLIGAMCTAVISIFTNYFIVYPIYTNFMPMETIIAAYQAILPGVKNLWHALIVFNMPFTFVKAMLSTTVCFLIYKSLAPVLRGKRR